MVFAEAPSFVRQEIKDDSIDFKTYDENTDGYRDANPNCMNQSLAYADIKSVSYISDGNFLNATIWLNSGYNSEIDLEKLAYGMYIDVDSVYESGIDYIYNTYFNTKNRTWEKEFIESSVPAAKITKIESNLDLYGKTHIDLSLPLKTLNYPPQYKIFFVTGANFNYIDKTTCELVDVTNFVSIPPPEFNMSTSPSILELRPGEEKYIQIKIQSKTNLDSLIFLPVVKHEKLEMNFTTNQMNILPLSTATTTLIISAPPNAQQESFSIPISMLIDFPKTTETTLGGKVSFENIASPELSKVSPYTVTILPDLTPSQNLNLFINSWITPISGLWSFLAGVAAVIAPLIIHIYRRRHNESDTKKSGADTKHNANK